MPITLSGFLVGVSEPPVFMCRNIQSVLSRDILALIKSMQQVKEVNLVVFKPRLKDLFSRQQGHFVRQSGSSLIEGECGKS